MISTLAISNIKDDTIRHNFQILLHEFGMNPFLNSTFRVYDFTPAVPSTSANFEFKIKHNLGFSPKDVFVSYISNDATVSVEFTKTDRDFITLKISKPCSFRLIAGSVNGGK